MKTDKTKEKLPEESKLPDSDQKTHKKSFADGINDSSFVSSDLEKLNSLNAEMNMGACLDDLLVKTTRLITESFNVNHTDVYIASDDGKSLLYEKKKIKRERVDYFEKILPVKIPESIIIRLDTDNWYSKAMSGNEIRITQTSSDIESMVLAFIEGSYGSLPFKRHMSRLVAFFKKNNTIASLPLSLRGKKVALLDINFREHPSEADLNRINKFAEQIVLIIARKQDEMLILRQNEELKKLNADKDRLLSVLGHDLRSPFNAILGFSDLLLENLDELEQEKMKFYLVQINNSAKNTYNLLENLLLWARMQSGKTCFKQENIEFKNLCVNEISNLSPLAEKKEIKIRVSVNDNLQVTGDSYMYKMIVRNLVANAIKFTMPGGSVELSAQERKNDFQMIVSDTGVGISEKDLKKLFRPECIHSTPGTGNETGTGIGLLLCRELIEKNNGNIMVESELNKGSRFIVTMKKGQVLK